MLFRSHFFAEFFVVASAESADGRVKDAAELAPGVIIVEDVVGRIFLILPLTTTSFHHVYAIVITIEQCIYITQICSPCGLWPTDLSTCPCVGESLLLILVYGVPLIMRVHIRKQAIPQHYV